MTTGTRTLTVAFVVKLVAKEEKADEVGAFLAGAVSLANEEAGTLVWFALRTDPTTFWIVEAFASQAARHTHFEDTTSPPPEAHPGPPLTGPPESTPPQAP